MKAIMVMFDSLNRRLLPPYGCEWVHAPNFRRLAERAVTFDRSYICSMPCMPARRDLHTARPSFLHRSWGPLEPFDDSVPRILRDHGVHTHLATDHYHYFEDGGCTYHTKYSTWEFFRGQEGDPWIGYAGKVEVPPCVTPREGPRWIQDWINRPHMSREEEQPQSKTFAAGLDYIRRNHREDRWFLQIETFDPHEPFFSHRKYKDLYWRHYHHYQGKHFDWPPYRRVRETAAEVEHCRYEYASLLSMCDANLGHVLDLMDELALWDDTMLVVWTDHGFLLGEHDCWAKVWMPWYQELAHTPFFVWDPRCGKRGERRQSLVQPSLDVGPTLLEYFGVPLTEHMLGKPLQKTIASDQPVREAALFGIFGGHVNVTDGRYVYMRAPASRSNQPLFQYTHMPMHMTAPFALQHLRQTQLAAPFRFTKGCPTMKIPGTAWTSDDSMFATYLWDVEGDPKQERPLQDGKLEARMIEQLIRLMRQCEAPPEQFERLGLPA